jgi:hypothetical protein
LKALIAQYAGTPGVPGGTTLAVMLAAILIVFALMPRVRGETSVLDGRIRWTLALAAFVPPLLTFFLARPPMRIDVFAERHVLPSLLAAVLIMSYGLWRIASVARRRQLVLAAGIVVMATCQASPVWSSWPGPSRHPLAAMADWLKRDHGYEPIYTTWPYGIGEPIMFYLRGRRAVHEFPGVAKGRIDMTFYLQASKRAYGFPDRPELLPDNFVVLYRPAAEHESRAVRSVLADYTIVEQKCYSAPNSRWGTCAAVMRRHTLH